MEVPEKGRGCTLWGLVIHTSDSVLAEPGWVQSGRFVFLEQKTGGGDGCRAGLSPLAHYMKCISCSLLPKLSFSFWCEQIAGTHSVSQCRGRASRALCAGRWLDERGADLALWTHGCCLYQEPVPCSGKFTTFLCYCFIFWKTRVCPSRTTSWGSFALEESPILECCRLIYKDMLAHCTSLCVIEFHHQITEWKNISWKHPE